jgi:hypothetical protein
MTDFDRGLPQIVPGSFRHSANANGCRTVKANLRGVSAHIVPSAAPSHIAAMTDNHRPRVERPRVEPEIIPPHGRSRRGGFDSLFIRVDEGDDGIRRVYLKKPGPFTIILILLAAGAVAALFFLLLAGLMLLWIPLIIIGILFAVFSVSARDLWSRMQGWFGGTRR